MKQIDTRGLSCPQPVVLVNNEIQTGNVAFEVLLDSQASLENVARLLNKNKLKFEISDLGEHFIYHVNR
ncbi:MAG: sulfurtransferase TusA family protein [Candidatus Cloacimonetes bacterium]|nr:sulfurtransferase TusA family protein [Candidatus Cloacimonadota bacterium]